MATTTHDLPHDRRTGADRRAARAAPRRDFAEGTRAAVLAAGSAEGIRVSWGGIWGGVLSAVGLLLLLAALGLAVGITATDPQQADAGTLGTAAGIWAAASLLIALFVGGMVATRIGATYDRSTGFWEGALVWVVSLLLMAYLASSGISSLAGGAFSVMGARQQAAATAAAPQGGAGMVDQMKSRIGEATGAIQQKGAEVKPAASRAAWATFAALVLSLAASLFGAMAGRRRTARRVERY
jgi:hypothetical protein